MGLKGCFPQPHHGNTLGVKGTQATVTTWQRLKLQQEVRSEHPGPEGAERQRSVTKGETNWYQLDLLGTWKNPLPHAMPSLEISSGVTHLPSVCEVLGSVPTTKQQQKTLKQDLHACFHN